MRFAVYARICEHVVTFPSLSEFVHMQHAFVHICRYMHVHIRTCLMHTICSYVRSDKKSH